MSLAQQIFWGSCFLGACLLVQTICLALSALILARVTRSFENRRLSLRFSLVLSLTLVMIILALTIQVWIWAAVYIGYDILPDWNSAVYFSLVTFTALGYGDIVLGPEVRIFASFGSVTGLLSFGVSTAFLVAMMRLIGNKPDTPPIVESNGIKGSAMKR